MRKFILFCLLLIAGQLLAQDTTLKRLKTEAGKEIKKDANDTIPQLWKKGGVFSLTMAQGSLSNWAAGGDDFALAFNTILSMFAFYKKDVYSWDNTFDFSLGLINTTSQGSRKNDDRIDLLSKAGRAISSNWNIAALVNFRTQILNGYKYGKDNEKTLTSRFFAPAYLITTLGLDYKPNDHFSVFVSPITTRWVFVKDDSLSAKGVYGVDPGAHSRTEIGAFLTATCLTDVEKPFSYKGRLDLFSNYRHNPEKIDVYMSNLFAVKLSKVLAVTWNVELIYDDDVRIFGDDGHSPALQFKSLVGVGLSVKF
jgi:hypothetical protein